MNRGTGQAYVYTYDSTSGKWATGADVAATLAQTKDANGYAIGWTFTLPDGTVEQYDALGRIAAINVLQGTSYEVSYDVSGRLASVQNNYGRAITFAYDASGRLASLTDPSGASTQYTYDASSRLIEVTYPDQRTVQYVYESTTWPFALTGIIHGSGARFATFTYDAQGQPTSNQFAGGVGGGSVTYPSSQTATITEPDGTAWNKSFVTNQSTVQLASDAVTCSGCPTQASQVTYDSAGALTSYVNKAGVATYYLNDASHRPNQIIEAAGTRDSRTTLLTWHPTLNVPTQITQGDHTLTYQYDSQGRMTQKTITAGSANRAIAYSYDGQGLVTQIDGPRTDVNDVTSYAYDSLGNLTTVTNALGQVTTYSAYNALGEPGRINYPNGTSRTYSYDARGRVLTESYLGNTRSSTYDANGNLATVSDSDGSGAVYHYDDAERLTGVDNVQGEKLRYTLDTKGDVTLTDTYDAANNLVLTSSTQYDGMRRIKKKIDANGNTTKYSYDATGNMLSATDSMNNITSYQYDVLNRLLVTQDALSQSVQKAYDTWDHVTSIQDSLGNTTDYSYDGFGDNTAVASPDTGSTSYTFDGGGNVVTSDNARGIIPTLSYDGLGRLYRVSYPGGESYEVTYDSAVNGVGHIASMTDPAGLTSYTYDSFGHIASKTQTVEGVTLQVSYARDAVGRITGITYPSGKTLTISYSDERPNALTWDGASVISGIQYFPMAGPESWLFGGTVAYTRYTDANGRAWKYLTPTGSRTLSRDSVGRVTQLTDSSSGLTQTFGYDDVGRLTSFAGFATAPTNETRSYSYDSNGNRLSANVNGVPSTYAYSAGSNRLASVSGLYTNTYDASGNLTSDGERAYAYDSRGRVIGVTALGSNQHNSYKYNALGQWVLKTDDTSGAGVVLMYDENGYLIGEYAYPSGAPIEEFIWLGSTPVAVAGEIPVSCQTPPCTAYGIGRIWTDQLDTPRAITNGAGAVVWSWDSAPFGDTAANENPSGLGSFEFNLRFAGQYFDQFSGLNQNGLRLYDPTLGRYVQSDPAGLAGGANTYAYVRNDPVNSIDPTGLFCLTSREINAIAGGVGGAFSGVLTGLIDGKTPAAAVAGLIIGGAVGAGTGYAGTSSEGQSMVGGVASGGLISFTTPSAGVVGGAFAGGITFNLEAAGVPDTYAGMVGASSGGTITGVISGYLSQQSLSSGAKGGLNGLSGAALTAAVAQALRGSYQCGCSQ